MIWVIVGGIVGLAVWIGMIGSVATDRYSDGMDIFLVGGVLGLIFATTSAAAVAAALNGLMLPILHGNEQHQTDTYQLQAIAARSDLHGQFFLGSGQVDSDPAYRFYRDTKDGGFILDSADASTAVVYQDDSTPRVVHHWITQKHPWWCVFTTGGDSYEIHVPKGSITTSTNLDLP